MPLPGASLDEDRVCDLEVQRRAQVKREPGRPKILVCIPVGNKTEPRIFKQPDQGRGGCLDPSCPCSLHGKELAADWRNPGMVPFEWALNHMQLIIPLGTTVAYLAIKNQYSGPARDQMTRRALELDPEYIFYWDDDVLLDPHTFYKMHNMLERHPDVGLLTGVVCTREDPTEPMIYQESGAGAWWDFSIDPNHPPEDIFSAGGGCLMVRTEAVKKMTPPYWQDCLGGTEQPGAEGRSVWGHDVYFISKLRRESGMRTCVMGSVLCGHFDMEKQKEYTLPKDSPPYRKLGRQAPPEKAKNPVWGIQECAEWSPEFVRGEVQANGGERKLFFVPKRLVKSPMRIRRAMLESFEGARVVSVDDHWLAVGEGVRNGGNHSEPGDPSRPD